jgi:threonine dehydrogenase-like Zn-dependent dehydrogenase
VLRENMAFALPPGIPLTRGALVEPLAIGVHTARVAALGGSPSSVVAVGGGTIGLCCLIAAGKLFGATTLAVDIGETKRKLALAVGAAQFVDAAAGDAPAAICDALDGGADVTFLASGHPRALDDAVACTRSGGTVVVVSFFPGPARLDMNAAVRREVSMKTASLCTRADVETVLEWAGRGELAAERLVTHRFPLAQAGRALQMLAGRSRQVGKILLEAPDTTSEDVQ